MRNDTFRPEQPLVSVIMSVYNTPDNYLIESIDSILHQTYSNLEFVIVNDGSCDAVQERLLWYRDRDDRIRVIKNECNIGLTKSLNIGLGHCDGKYIARMDSDDISMPDRIEKQVLYMEEHPEICMTGTMTVGFGDHEDSEEILDETGHYSNQEVCEVHLLFENTGYAHPTFLLRKEFLDHYGIRYREDIPRAQDYALTTDIIIVGGQRHLLEEPLLKYRIHKDQISVKSYNEQIECQAATAFRRLRFTFSELTDEECWAIARLNHDNQDYTPQTIIHAIKKVFWQNKELVLFRDNILRREFYYEWYRKCMRITRLTGKPWGLFRWFTVQAIPSVMCIKAENLITGIQRKLKG